MMMMEYVRQLEPLAPWQVLALTRRRSTTNSSKASGWLSPNLGRGDLDQTIGADGITRGTPFYHVRRQTGSDALLDHCAAGPRSCRGHGTTTIWQKRHLDHDSSSRVRFVPHVMAPLVPTVASYPAIDGAEEKKGKIISTTHAR